jgi:hypothetical protein
MGEEGSEGAAVEANEIDGAVLESTGEMGEYDDIVAVDLDDAGREAVPRNRRDSEREEDLKERSGVWVDVEREGVREEEVFVAVDEVDRVVMCLGGDVDSDEAVGDSE